MAGNAGNQMDFIIEEGSVYFGGYVVSNGKVKFSLEQATKAQRGSR